MKSILIVVILAICGQYCHAQLDLRGTYDKAVEHTEQHNYAEAIRGFGIVLASTDNSNVRISCYVNRSIAYSSLREHAKAVADLDSALALDSTDTQLYLYRGDSRFEILDVDGAARDFNTVISRNVSNADVCTAHEFLWKITYRQKDYRQAVVHATALIECSPGEAALYFNRGVAKEMMLDFEGAILDYDLAIAHNPKYGDAYLNRGNAKINVLQLENPKVKVTMAQKASGCDDLRRAQVLGVAEAETHLTMHCK